MTIGDSAGVEWLGDMNFVAKSLSNYFYIVLV